MKKNPEGIAFLKENGFEITRYTKTPEIFTSEPAFYVDGIMGVYPGAYTLDGFICTGYCLEGSILSEYSRRDFSDWNEANEMMEKLNDLFDPPTIGGKRNVLVEKYISKVDTVQDSVFYDDDDTLPF